MTEPLFLCEMIWIVGLAGRVARRLSTTNPAASCSPALLHCSWFSLPPSSRATTAGSWRFLAWIAIGIVRLRRGTLAFARLLDR